jgi:D-alanyl-lipoteichoic acid acyltransferase DltB (MBOAT superfamily)
MLFNSLPYFLFFPVVALLFFLLPQRFRWLLLLVASCGFYMYFIPKYILILGFTIIIDYFAGLLIEGAVGARRKAFLVLSILANVGVLVVFKYFDFLSQSLSSLASFVGWNYSLHTLALILPVGLSFHTFQAMSYTIEVYRGHQPAERHFGIYALYVMFFPQLVAGPIERPQNLLPQFRVRHAFDYARVTSGLRLMAWGLFKKTVVADRLALFVNPVYQQPDRFDGPVLALATVAFAFQIYGDFSGYSDIAIGSARVLGFRLMRNFDRPYQALSVGEFWRRWHISLSTWFRDYLYLPLGGNRVTTPRWAMNILLVFLVSGLWHGANWTFVIWGALHGGYLLCGAMTRRYREELPAWSHPRLGEWMRRAFTFSLVCIAWVFFRATSVSEAVTVLGRGVQGWHVLAEPRLLFGQLGGVLTVWLALGFAAVWLMTTVERWSARPGALAQYLSGPPWIRWGGYFALVAVVFFLHAVEPSQFIYFQF